MPTVSALLSGSVSVGILAGVVSGLFYLVFTGIRWAGKLRSSLPTRDQGCPRCDASTSGLKCSDCARHREVKLQSGEWFYRHIQSRFCRADPISENNNTAHENGAAMDPDSAQVREFIERLVETLVAGQLDDVKVNRVYAHPEYDRMFSCHHATLCENLVRLSFALQMAIANKPLSEEDTPSAVHTVLKQQVQRIIQEAMTLPNLKSQVPVQNGNSLQKWDDDITSMTYEDILATAILNKVIERFQQKTGITLHDTVDGNSNLLAPSSLEPPPKYISRVEIGVNGTSNPDDASSQEGLGSWSESSHTEPLSMTIEECIEEEVTTYDSAGEEEDRSSDGMATVGSELDFYLSGLNFIKQRRVPFPELGVDIVEQDVKEDVSDEEDESSRSPHPTDIVSPVDSWEENWLFQRRRLKMGGANSSAQPNPMPVPMLVPNPSEDFRARIGDRDAEEVSDLSDCSDGALEDIVLAGIDTDARIFQIPQVSVTSVEELCGTVPEEHSSAGHIATTEAVLDEELTKASSVECLSEFGQQDSEYTEDYASVTQRQLSSLTEQVPVPRPRTLPVTSQDKMTPETSKQHTELATPPRPGTDLSDANLPCSGTIAEREHRKWESAPPLPNNPYSPENINKRLRRQSAIYSSRSSSATSFDFPEFKDEPLVSPPLQVVCTSAEPDFRRYGRDYYINESKASSGERRSSSMVTPTLLQQKTHSNEGAKTDGLLTTDSPEVVQLYGRVESEIAKWQEEINHTEEQWLRKWQQSSSAGANDAAMTNGKARGNTVGERKKSSVDVKGMDMTPSECSTVSSDLDCDAHVPIVLPSVKELAKQFSGGGTSDSDSSITKGCLSTPSRRPESTGKPVPACRSVVIIEREKRSQPVQEVHSLTARSISREFREGLRRNLPTHLDRNLHTTSDVCNGVGDSSCSSPEPVIANGSGVAKIASADSRDVHMEVRAHQKCDIMKETGEADLYNLDVEIVPKETIGGYTSDESGTRSLTPPTGGRRKLQNNIAFWEQLQRNCK